MMMNIDSVTLPNGCKLGDCQVNPLGAQEDLYLMGHNTAKKEYKLHGKVGLRTGTTLSAEGMHALITAKNAMEEIKKRENEVRPVVNPKERRDVSMTFRLYEDQAEYVYGKSEGAKREKMRREKGEKRVRETDENAIRMIYEKFEEKPFWTLKNLGVATQQPDVFEVDCDMSSNSSRDCWTTSRYSTPQGSTRATTCSSPSTPRRSRPTWSFVPVRSPHSLTVEILLHLARISIVYNRIEILHMLGAGTRMYSHEKQANNSI